MDDAGHQAACIGTERHEDMRRTALIAANWKMNKTPAEATSLTQSLALGLKSRHLGDLELVLCPPFVDLRSVAAVIEYERSPMSLGAQDVHWLPEGAYTGAISASMLADVGCRYCIVGHSERRRHFAETDQQVGLKMAALSETGLSPILCVGESQGLREQGEQAAFDHVAMQLDAALSAWGDRNDEEAFRLVVAYEPIWSIGTGQTATPHMAEAMAMQIRMVLAQRLGEVASESVRILYGGSLSSENIAPFMHMPNIDGGLVGGASLDAVEFSRLVINCSEALRHIKGPLIDDIPPGDVIDGEVGEQTALPLGASDPAVTCTSCPGEA
jgi:triosephosphate isomerase